MVEPHFTPHLFRFLRDLKKNNERDWFLAHKKRYEEHVRDPMCRFVEELAPELRRISRHYVADPRPVGGSLFRIQRDTRFSPDKTPYKTHAAIQLRHAQGRDVHAPGFYLHLEPGSVFAGGGLWHPDGATLAQVRSALVAHPERWKKALSARSFRALLTIEGEKLSRPPRGYDPEHPLIEDIKRKDFVCLSTLSEEDACTAGFLEKFIQVCSAAAPFMEFLTVSVGLSW